MGLTAVQNNIQRFHVPLEILCWCAEVFGVYQVFNQIYTIKQDKSGYGTRKVEQKLERLEIVLLVLLN